MIDWEVFRILFIFLSVLTGISLVIYGFYLVFSHDLLLGFVVMMIVGAIGKIILFFTE